MDYQNFIDELNEKINIVEVVSQYVQLRKQGRNYVGLCPFHNEKTPSFVVSPEKNMFFCFGCKTGGNVITFIQKIEKMDFREAIEFLREKAGLPLIEFKKGIDKNLKEELYSILEFSKKFYVETLFSNEGSGAIEYLKRRGLTSEVIENFELGYAPKDAHILPNRLKKENYSKDSLIKSGLIREGEDGSLYSFFIDRVMFPIHNTFLKTIAFGGRVIESSKGPKYLNIQETVLFNKGNILYPINLTKEDIRKENMCIVTEGYMDSISLYQHGVKNILATLGTAFTKEHTKLIKRFTDNVVLCFDNDEAGKTAAKLALFVGEKENVSIKIAVLKDGKDPDEIINKEGREKFLENIDLAISPSDFLYEITMKKYNLKDLIDKNKFTNEIFEYLKEIGNRFLIGDIIKRMSRDLKIDEDELKLMFNSLIKPAKTNMKKGKLVGEKPFSSPLLSANPIFKTESCLIQAILSSDDYAGLVFETLSNEDINNEDIKEIFKILKNEWKTYKKINLQKLLPFLDNGKQSILSEIIMKDSSMITDEVVLEYVDKIFTYKQKQKAKQIQELIEDDEDLKEYILFTKKLNRRIIKK